MMDEAPIRLYVMGSNEWRTEDQWPLAHTEWTPFYLRAQGKLSRETEDFYREPDTFVQEPLFMTADISSLTYEAAPLQGP